MFINKFNTFFNLFQSERLNKIKNVKVKIEKVKMFFLLSKINFILLLEMFLQWNITAIVIICEEYMAIFSINLYERYVQFE